MRARLKLLALIVVVLLSAGLHATGADISPVLPVDASACLSAISASDDDGLIGKRGALIDNKTARADRLKALEGDLRMPGLRREPNPG